MRSGRHTGRRGFYLGKAVLSWKRMFGSATKERELGNEASTLDPGLCCPLGPTGCPCCREFQGLHLRETLEKVGPLWMDAHFLASLGWTSFLNHMLYVARVPQNCGQVSGKPWFPSASRELLQPCATLKCIFDFESESLKTYLRHRWWKLITSCVLTEFWTVLKIFIFPPKLWRCVNAA